MSAFRKMDLDLTPFILPRIQSEITNQREFIENRYPSDLYRRIERQSTWDKTTVYNLVVLLRITLIGWDMKLTRKASVFRPSTRRWALDPRGLQQVFQLVLEILLWLVSTPVWHNRMSNPPPKRQRILRSQ